MKLTASCSCCDIGFLSPGFFEKIIAPNVFSVFAEYMRLLTSFKTLYKLN